MNNLARLWSTATLASLSLLGGAAAQEGVEPGGAEIVQTGAIFTGVIQGNQTFAIPIVFNGFARNGKLRAVEVTLDVRMSGEYTIQPTAVPPNGIVEAHSTTSFSRGALDLGAVDLHFTPLPWVFPVNFPLNVLWAQDAGIRRVFTDPPTMAAFAAGRPLVMASSIDINTLVMPKNWAAHVAGVFVVWRVKYVYAPTVGSDLDRRRDVTVPALPRVL